MSNYWFARSMVGGHVGRGVTPLNWQGRAVIAGFVVAMVGGGVAFLSIALLTKYFMLGVLLFACCALAGGGTFIWAATTKSDPVPRTLKRPQ